MTNEVQFPAESMPDMTGDGMADALIEKLADAMTPGFVAECDPAEAERAGAFAEDAMSEADALESAIDLAEQRNG